MKNYSHPGCRVFLLIVLSLILFTGCGKKEDTPSLRIVTERTISNGMNQQAQQMIEQFQEKYPEFTVKLEILPEKKTEREIVIKQIRSQLMSGRGPDIFLLPTKNTVLAPKYLDPVGIIGPPPPEFSNTIFVDMDTDEVYPMERRVVADREPLFPDVAQTMENKLFLDLSDYYDADESLGRDCLNQKVMDAGTVNGKRYILPIRYDMPVMYVDKEKLGDFGLTLEELDCNILELMDLAIASGDRRLAASVEPFILRIGRGFSYLPQTLDYRNDQVLLEPEILAAFFEKLQTVESMIGRYSEHRALWLEGPECHPYRLIFENGRRGGRVIGSYYHQVFPCVNPMRVFTMQDMPLVREFQGDTKQEFAMLPLRSIADRQTAYVTYYGAVSAGCRHPAEAYELLSMFLSEDAQFERFRSYKNTFLTAFYAPRRTDERLIEDGWPVRTKGSTEEIWKITRVARRSRSIRYLDPTEKDFFSPLNAEIDYVTFGSVLEQEFSRMVRSLNDQDTGEPTDVDIDAMAEYFIRQLRWQVMEG